MLCQLLLRSKLTVEIKTKKNANECYQRECTKTMSTVYTEWRLPHIIQFKASITRLREHLEKKAAMFFYCTKKTKMCKIDSVARPYPINFHTHTYTNDLCDSAVCFIFVSE